MPNIYYCYGGESHQPTYGTHGIDRCSRCNCDLDSDAGEWYQRPLNAYWTARIAQSGAHISSSLPQDPPRDPRDDPDTTTSEPPACEVLCQVCHRPGLRTLLGPYCWEHYTDCFDILAGTPCSS